jgi:hypothetical protein
MPKVMRTDHNETWDAEGNLVKTEVVETDVTVEVNRLVVSDVGRLLERLDEIREFLSDPDVQAALDLPDNKRLDAKTQNRLNRLMIRQARLTAFMLKGLSIYVYGEEHPNLFDDVDNT